IAERPRADDLAAPRAGTVLAAVDGVTCALAVEPRLHERARVREHLLRVGLLRAQPRRHARVPARLVHPHVPDPGDLALVLQGLAEEAVETDGGQVPREDVRPEAM